MRILPLIALLSLCACSTDVFVGADGGSSDGSGGTDGGNADAPAVVANVKCGQTTCTGHTCCSPGVWDVTQCLSSTLEGQSQCQRYLECDDFLDCPATQVCCGVQGVDNVGQTVLNSARCQSTCGGTTSSVQLCNSDGECKSGNCQGYNAAPSWVKTCQ